MAIKQDAAFKDFFAQRIPLLRGATLANIGEDKLDVLDRAIIDNHAALAVSRHLETKEDAVNMHRILGTPFYEAGATIRDDKTVFDQLLAYTMALVDELTRYTERVQRDHL
jgi:hypothetical protein